jgi:hypothetical protein
MQSYDYNMRDANQWNLSPLRQIPHNTSQQDNRNRIRHDGGLSLFKVGCRMSLPVVVPWTFLACLAASKGTKTSINTRSQTGGKRNSAELSGNRAER